LTTLPEKLADELGIKSISKDKIQTASGILTIKKGRAIIRIEKKEELQPLWISDIIDKVLIGSVTLETLGLRVNPITGKIEETPLMLY
jgi:predicted aspartyl protease